MQTKNLIGFPGYEISDRGVVTRSGEMIKHWIRPKGYISVNLRLNGKNKSQFVHRLVLEAFVGPCPKGMQTRHLDGNPGNNQLDNLKWGTPKENTDDRISHGHTCGPRGETHPRSKIKIADVIEIRKGVLSDAAWAEKLGIDKSHVCGIRIGLYWKSVPMK